MTNQNLKLIANQEKWAEVSKELEAEKIKLAFYDNTIIPLLGNINKKKVLDYGGGPGVLLTALKKLGAKVKEYDISEYFRKQAAEKIGINNIYKTVDEIPSNYFDFVICNLVLCIVNEDEVKRIVTNIKNTLNKKGVAYIGFCNPKLLNIPETNLDLRPKPNQPYEKNHSYIKTKKEGGYQIIENHRPIEWYENVYKEIGLTLKDTIYTSEYKLNGCKIKDFIIFKLIK
ncbi:class I SAM-dependent methyltransferase [Patescibacteria group bacterium]|nr:class I SAM-dependent methyltransferase [Patescibacteria group bacterium]MBU1721314.1 class I SAM-dependent methyltransferase [Patescibacteria group bacterium]MBU1901744.1 class I SAM-dependent methyltransferase [Patescibacteria group bacterium]